MQQQQTETDWYDCFEMDGWRGMLTPAAKDHPCKFSRKLAIRIVDHLWMHRWATKESVVIDPYAGVGLGGIVCCRKGIRWVGVETEPGYVAAARDVFKINHCNDSHRKNPQIIHGDSRRLLAVLNGNGWHCPVDIVFGGPPTEIQQTGGGLATVRKGGRYKLTTNAPTKNCGYQDVGDSPGQTASMTGNQFWAASRMVLDQCYRKLRSGGHAIWVTKDYVRDGYRVPFSDIWQAECEAVGFKLVCAHKAWKVRETVTEGFFYPNVKRREFKSMFRRMKESKGSPPIDWEDVRCFIKG